MRLSIMSILENAAQKAKESGSMIAFPVLPRIGASIQGIYKDTPGDVVEPRDMHMTIGLIQNHKGKEKKIQKILNRVAEQFKPLRCSISEFGKFPPNENNENKWVLYAKPEIDEAHDFHKICHKTMKKYGVNINNGSFDFSPHITIKYCDNEPDIERDVSINFTIDSVGFFIGDKRWRASLG